MEIEDEYEESQASDEDPDDLEVDYSNLIDEEDLDEDIYSDDDSETDDILPENNHIRFNIISNNELYLKCQNQPKKMHPYLTNFEKIKILAARAEQIENNCPVLIDVPPEISSSRDIAELEYREKKIPFIIRRYCGNETEDWKLTEFLNY